MGLIRSKINMEVDILKRKDTSLSIAASELEKLIQKDNGVNNREQVKR